MNAALVKIDVVAADLGKSVERIEQMVDGGTAHESGFLWVFNLANNLNARCRDLRFWRSEIIAHAQGEADKYQGLELGQVIAAILPVSREKFHAGEVDQLFQIRRNTRIDYGAQLKSQKHGGRNFYSRPVLAEFLKCRWIGGLN